MTVRNAEGLYPVGSEFLPAVSTILDMKNKPFLYKWYGNVGNEEAERVKRESTDIGKWAHNYINSFCIEEEWEDYNTDKRNLNLIKNFHLFVDRFKPNFILNEYFVYSKVYKYAGTLDAVASVKVNTRRKIVLLDWKSSNQLSEDYELQGEAYYRALAETLNRDSKLNTLIKKVDDIWIVMLDKKKEINFKRDIRVLRPCETRFAAFLGLKDCYDWTQYRKTQKEIILN